MPLGYQERDGIREDGAVKRVAGVFVLLALTLSCASAAQKQTGTGAAERGMTADEKLVFRLTNAERLERDLPPLQFDPLLMEVARRHSRDMAERGYFAHLAPPPAEATPLDRYAKALGRKVSGVVGENIGRADQPLMGKIHASLMGSPDHRANILDVEYTRVGVGIFALPDGQVWVTEVFHSEEEPSR
jgi:uncharacterized protein YkwD